MYHILLCDDEEDILYALKIYLENPEYVFHEAHTGREAVRIVKEQPVELILMDIMMPELDGISAMQEIRKFSNAPIILLTAKSEDIDKIVGLNAGADDYITKPFNPLELAARVKSNLRRYTSLGSLNVENKSLYQVGGLVINDDTKQVTVDDESVKLTPIEYNILLLLVKNQGIVFPSIKFMKEFGMKMPSVQIIP